MEQSYFDNTFLNITDIIENKFNLSPNEISKNAETALALLNRYKKSLENRWTLLKLLEDSLTASMSEMVIY